MISQIKISDLPGGSEIRNATCLPVVVQGVGDEADPTHCLTIPQCYGIVAGVSYCYKGCLRPRAACEVYGLPEPADGVYYIVTEIVFEASSRTDLLTVHTYIKDGAGRPVAVKSFRIRS